MDERFEAMVSAHHGGILGYLARTVRHRSEAEDLAQETFLRAFRAYRSLPPDANVRAWLFAIATNLRRNHFRAERRRRVAYAAVGGGAEGEDREGPEEGARSEEARSRIETIVDGLPLKQRLAFTLRKLHDLDYETIARSLDCSPDSARAHVFQALRKIRAGLDLSPPSRRERLE
jgi:RNA polymerase sigma-70 factor (ECF subfamily)